MKKILFSFLIIMPLLMSCDTLSELTKFDLPVNESITFPAAPATNENITIETPAIKTNIDSVLTAQKLSVDEVDKISLKALKFTLSSPATGDLSFLKNVEIYLTSPGADAVKVASIENITATTKTYDITVGNVNLKDYILKETFGLKIVASTDKATLVEQKIDVAMVFLVDLKVLGL